ncbi:MAG: hypothetical protein EA397_08055 [Deltaproteobacteria bacterium]|nr:MAG: hypothetical protein EA397_08055 [Deltaproteobacteria bacterium]
MVSGEAAVPVQLQFTSLSRLHRGFFLREEGVVALGKALAACGGEPVTVEVAYDQEALQGRIVGWIPPGQPVCAPVQGDEGLDLRPMRAMAAALASYRDDVAGRSDFRVANFKVFVQTSEEPKACRFEAAGQYPPDGSTFSPCVMVAGERVCAASEEQGVVLLKPGSGEQAARLSRCTP